MLRESRWRGRSIGAEVPQMLKNFMVASPFFKALHPNNFR